MRVDGATNPELIHQWRARPDLAADADRHAPEACRRHQPHSRRNAQVGRITRFVFKEDRAGLHMYAVRQTPG